MVSEEEKTNEAIINKHALDSALSHGPQRDIVDIEKDSCTMVQFRTKLKVKKARSTYHNKSTPDVNRNEIQSREM